MPGLILEGGTFRPIFSCGVMDALLEEDIMFPYCIGVSAGICDAVSYISRQKGRNLQIAMKFRADKRYIGMRNLLKERSIFGMNFIFNEIPNKYIPFDYNTYFNYKGKIVIGATTAETGKPRYFNGLKMGTDFQYLRATCALPMIIPAIKIGKYHYYDGGVSDPIPIKKSIQDGNFRNLIVLTRPKGYQKVLSKSNLTAAKALQYKYPAVSNLLLHRHLSYNDTIAFCEQLEREKRAIILRPDYPIHSLEKDKLTLKSSYDHGYTKAKEKISQIRELFR